MSDARASGTENGYTRLLPVPMVAPAEMLESWAGYGLGRVSEELGHARRSLESFDVASLRWLACGIARRLADLEVDFPEGCKGCAGGFDPLAQVDRRQGERRGIHQVIGEALDD